MSKRLFLLYVLLLMLATTLTAQSKYGTRATISLEKQINKKWKTEIEQEIRTVDLLNRVKRWSIGANIEYKIASPLRVGATYQLLNVFDRKYQNYQFRNRFESYLTGKLSLHNFKFSLKESVRVTTKNDSKRIKKNGKIDTYKINPAWIWKSAFKVEYNIPKCKLTPGYEFEAYYELNNPDGNQFEKTHNTLYFKYKINKHNGIKLFGLINSKKEEKDDDFDFGKYILGVKYGYTF